MKLPRFGITQVLLFEFLEKGFDDILTVFTTNKSPQDLDAFSIPRYGGVIIHNTPANYAGNDSSPDKSYHISTTLLKPYMELFVQQLRALLDIDSIVPEGDFDVHIFTQIRF